VRPQALSLVQGGPALTPNEGQTAAASRCRESGTRCASPSRRKRARSCSRPRAKLGVRASDLKVAKAWFSILPQENFLTEIWKATRAQIEGERCRRSEREAAHKWIGKSIPRRDIPKEIHRGAALRGRDVRLPGNGFWPEWSPLSQMPRFKSVSLDSRCEAERRVAGCATGVSRRGAESERNRR